MFKRKNTVTSIWMSLYAFFSNVPLDLIGRIMIGELIALATFPFIRFKQLFYNYPILKKITFCYVGLLCSLIFSDIINGTAPEYYLRGWFNIIFSYISLCFLLYRINDKSIVYYFLFYSVSCLIFGEAIEMDTLLSDGSYFKVRIAAIINPLIYLLAYFSGRKHKKTSIFILLGYGLLSIILGARSNSLGFLLGALLLYAQMRGLLSTRRFVVTCTVILCISYAGYCMYVSNVLNGNITSANSKQLLNTENPYNPVSLLKEGRRDFWEVQNAIMVKPFIGYGSWAKIDDFIHILPYEYRHINSISGNIPGHSVIWGYWLWAGIMGFIFIILLVFNLFKLLWKTYRKQYTRFSILLLPIGIGFIWNALFSPPGHLRQTFPIAIAVIIYAYYYPSNLFTIHHHNNEQ